MKDDKKNELSLDIMRLRERVKKASMDFCRQRSELMDGYFNPIEWTGLIISGYLSAMFDELHCMGNMVYNIEGNDLYSKKVASFERSVKRLSKEMSEVMECFTQNKIH